VAERVKADPGQARPLRRRHEHPSAQAADVGGRALAAGKNERVVGCSERPPRAQRHRELGGQRHQPRPVARLRGACDAADDRPADPQPRRVRVELEIAPAQRDRLRDPQAGQPVDEVLHGSAIEVADENLAVEIAQREVDQQPPVLAARVGAHAVATRTGVAIKPRQAELVQRRAAAQRSRLAVAPQWPRPTWRPTAYAADPRPGRSRRTSTPAGRRPAPRSA
jgi:hypothetical protein